VEKVNLSREGKKQFFLTPLQVSVLATLLLLAILTVVAMTSLKLYGRYDTTVTRRYSLSEQTLSVLENIHREVRALGFFTPAHPHEEKTVELLKQISDATKYFTFEIINPEKNPGRTRKYGKIVSGTLVLESGERWEKVLKPNENTILSAVIRITGDEERGIYFTVGHGEQSLDDTAESGLAKAMNALGSLAFDASPVNLLKLENVPEDADVVVISGPTKDFFVDELDNLYAYIEKGGSLLIMMDPDHLPELEQFCQRFGIHLGRGVIIDKSKKITGSDFLMTLVDQYSNHDITGEIDSVSIFPLSRSVQVSGVRREGITLFPLVRTSDESWIETDVFNLFNNGICRFDELEDERGPHTIAVACEVEGVSEDMQNKVGRIIVFGDSDFVQNTYFDQGANGDLFMNSVLWLSREKDIIASPPVVHEFYPIILTKPQLQLLFWLAVILLPLLSLFIGIFVIRKIR